MAAVMVTKGDGRRDGGWIVRKDDPLPVIITVERSPDRWDRRCHGGRTVTAEGGRTDGGGDGEQTLHGSSLSWASDDPEARTTVWMTWRSLSRRTSLICIIASSGRAAYQTSETSHCGFSICRRFDNGRGQGRRRWRKWHDLPRLVCRSEESYPCAGERPLSARLVQ